MQNIAPNLGVEKAPVKARNKRKIDEVDDDSIASDLSVQKKIFMLKYVVVDYLSSIIDRNIQE